MATTPNRLAAIDKDLIAQLQSIADDPATEATDLHGVVLFYKRKPPELYVRSNDKLEIVPDGEDYQPVDTKQIIRADQAGVVVYTRPDGSDPVWWWVGTTRMHSS